MEEPDWRKMMLTMTFLIAAIIGIISLILMARYRPPPKDQAAVLYRKFTQKAGLPPNRGETPLAYAVRLGEDREELADDVERVTGHYLLARYAEPDATAIASLRAAVNQFST